MYVQIYEQLALIKLSFPLTTPRLEANEGSTSALFAKPSFPPPSCVLCDIAVGIDCSADERFGVSSAICSSVWKPGCSRWCLFVSGIAYTLSTKKRQGEHDGEVMVALLLVRALASQGIFAGEKRQVP